MRALIAIFTAAVLPGYTAAACLEYGRVSLIGTLVRQTYPGAPEYESFHKGDESVVVWILQLDTPTCVADGDGYAKLYHEREVQLVSRDIESTGYRALLGRRIIADGELRPGGARHETRLVLNVSELKRSTKFP